MDYFLTWKIATKGKSANQFLAPVTWYNLKLTVTGFIGYARHVLDVTEIDYVSMLHSNTSTLEATFSSIRSLGGRDARSYESRIGCRSCTSASRAVDKGKAYTTNDMLEEDNFVDNNFDKLAMKGLNLEISRKQREIDELMSIAGEENQNGNIVNPKNYAVFDEQKKGNC